MELIEGRVWCSVHNCTHDQTSDPYDYGYRLSGETPECGPKDWRKLWVGAMLEEGAE